jgi:ABC-type transporter Mla subunit MlaD
MDASDQDKLIAEANVVGRAMQKLSDENRELEAINATLRDALSRADEEISRKDAIIANMTVQLDDKVRDYDLQHAALIDINARVRETLGRQLYSPAKPQQITGAPARPLPAEQPMPRIVRQGPATG